MHRSTRLVTVSALFALTVAGSASASVFGKEVAGCARNHLGQREGTPSVVCSHHGTEMTFPTFGAMVLHMQEHHG
jgi:hypothetical protein